MRESFINQGVLVPLVHWAGDAWCPTFVVLIPLINKSARV